MNVARILYPVQVLGPGDRVGLWLCGCHRACVGCSNPELWEQKAEYEIPVERVAGLIEAVARDHRIDGFTISGGEPFLQAQALLQLLERLRAISTDILIYTGYRLEQLQAMHSEAVDGILQAAAVIVDGAYVEALNDGCVLRGSSNQRIHILSDAHRGLYEQYLSQTHNQIQNFTTVDGVVSVGIHRRTFTGSLPGSAKAEA